MIAFTGMPGSGKSEAVRIAKENGLPIVRMGDMVWDEVKSRGLPLDDAHVGRVAHDMRKQHGMDIWARRTLEYIQTNLKEESCLVIDGVRNGEEVAFFKQYLGDDFQVIAITASEDVRLKRILRRGRADDGSVESFKARDKREISWGLDRVIAGADRVISNEGSLEGFQKQIQSVFAQL